MLLSTVGADIALAASYDSPAHVTTTGDNTLNWTGQGTTNGEVSQAQCSGDTPNPGDLLWIFTTDGYTLTGTPELHVNNGTVESTTNHGGSWHFVTSGTSPDPAITDAWVTFNNTNIGGGKMVLTISHGCPAEEAAISEIVTEVHDADHNDITGLAVDLGSIVHDSATLSWNPPSAEVPAGSTVTFYFFVGVPDTLEPPCTADPATAADFVAFVLDGSETTPYTIEDALQQGPLGAGDYFYFAQFVSADTDVMTNATSVCEPFTVNKGDTETVTTVVRDDTGAPVAIGGSVPLGTSVHDTATVGPKVDDISLAGQLTYNFYENGDCDGPAAWSETVAVDADGVAADSSSTGPLTAGDYSFNAEYLGNDDYNASGLSDCEPFTVEKGDTETVTTVVRDDTGADVPIGGEVPIGTSVHDTAVVGPKVGDISLAALDGLTYYFYTNGTCTGPALWSDTVDVDADGIAGDSMSTGSLASGNYSFNAEYFGNDNYNASGLSACEPFSVFNAPLTPGYWKNHLAPISATCKSRDGCSANGPWTIQYLPQSLNGYVVNTTAQATAVWNKMNCSNTGSASAQNNNAIGCLAGHLLAAKLNVANGSNPCINATITAADAFLASIPYTGPTGNYSGITAEQRATAISLKSTLDTYNNGGGCP